ncbi:Asp23/Gls24 family envelope stress response protein [Herbidospora solisilvae]|uniref:Asp23/Gls24 family envelope stress response protein n=1 Tax=Herbidospora solisilvae TaxID=2696284 RepID=UPI00192A0CE4|nr:Asp23/Gls24 family envelope stress response protein [Herbidospora solisilvae]
MTRGRGRTAPRFDPAAPPDPGVTRPRTAPDAGRIAETVVSCPGVAGLTRGPFGTVATYRPGGSVPGVSLRDEAVEIHVAVRYGRPIPEIVDEVREAVSPLSGDRRVDVMVEDVTDTEEARKVG